MAMAMAMAIAGCSSGGDGVHKAADRVTTTAPHASRGNSGVSAGCDGRERTAPGRSDVTVRSGGRDRSYIRYVPKGVDPAVPAPLVIDFTPYSPATLEESFSGFTKPDADGKVKADEVGAVVVSPEPVNGKGLLTWNIDDTAGWTDDQRFVADLIDDVVADVCVDSGRVLAMGFAIGAVMASTVACEQSERITVLATASGLWVPPDCHPRKPVPALSFHGTDDHFLPFEGGVGDRVGQLGLSPETAGGLAAMVVRKGAVTSSSAWADRNGCDPRPREEEIVDTVRRLRWRGCDAAVELYVIDGGSHTWPGSNGMAAFEGLLGPVSPAITANDVIWDFFQAHGDRDGT